jgi:hypothetical protein
MTASWRLRLAAEGLRSATRCGEWPPKPKPPNSGLSSAAATPGVSRRSTPCRCPCRTVPWQGSERQTPGGRASRTRRVACSNFRRIGQVAFGQPLRRDTPSEVIRMMRSTNQSSWRLLPSFTCTRILCKRTSTRAHATCPCLKSESSQMHNLCRRDIPRHLGAAVTTAPAVLERVRPDLFALTALLTSEQVASGPSGRLGGRQKRQRSVAFQPFGMPTFFRPR